MVRLFFLNSNVALHFTMWIHNPETRPGQPAVGNYAVPALKKERDQGFCPGHVFGISGKVLGQEQFFLTQFDPQPEETKKQGRESHQSTS